MSFLSVKECVFIQKLLLRLIKDESFFTCGDSLVPADRDSLGLVAGDPIFRSNEVDTSYFTASLKHYLPPICIPCGSGEDLLDDTDPYITGLYEQFSVVILFCCNSKNFGKERTIWEEKICLKDIQRLYNSTMICTFVF